MFNNEWIWVVLVGVLLFGAGNLPKLAKGVGEGIREFKKALSPEDEKKATVSVASTGSVSKEK